MDAQLNQKFQDSIWIARSLFERNRVTGSAANLSFRHADTIYITGSGTCFGRLSPENFSAVSLDGKVLNNVKPSKELPLHLMCYQKSGAIGAVIHTHSFYATLYACVLHECQKSVVPDYTPYLKMKVGNIALVPYAQPGSQELFALFRQKVNSADAYLLANHGGVVPGISVMDAFYNIEELEESCHIAWELEQNRREGLSM